MSVVHDSVFYETSSYRFKELSAFLILVRKLSRDKFRNTKAWMCTPSTRAVLPINLALSSPFRVQIGLARQGIRSALSLPDVPPISTITSTLQLKRGSNRPGEMSLLLPLLSLLGTNNSP